VLVLDEIFAVGDQEFRARCEARYRELSAQGHTVVLVSHEPRIVSAFCTRALLLEDGIIVKEGSGEDVVRDYAERMAAAR
jgi:lipopolysaccharide transport system ATP-binding protein